MKYMFLVSLAAAFVSAIPVSAQQISDDSLATVLTDFSDYCFSERDRQKLNDLGTADIILQPNAITIYQTVNGPVTILDAGRMHCESGGYGYCGVGRCTNWLFHNGRSQAYLDSVAVSKVGDKLDFLLCDGPDSELAQCSKLDLNLFHDK